MYSTFSSDNIVFLHVYTRHLLCVYDNNWCTWNSLMYLIQLHVCVYDFESSSYILLQIGVSSLYYSSLSMCSQLEWPQNMRMILSGLACCVSKAFLCHNYPVRICTAGLCVWLRRFVYMWPKKGCLRSYCLKIFRWCNLLLACRVSSPKKELILQMIHSGKEIQKHSINRTREGFP